MSWRDKLQAASFRGIGFYVESSDVELGRNIVAHELPHVEDVFVEDLGIKSKKYSIQAFVVGEEYMAARDNLVAALQKPGNGELVHPFYGRLNVYISALSVRETATEGRMARISFSCIEAGLQTFPSQNVNVNTALSANADSVISAATTNFTTNSFMSDVPDFVRQGSMLPVAGVASGMKALVNAGTLANSVSSTLRTTTSYINNVARFNNGITQLISPAPSYIETASAFAGLLTSTVSLVNLISSDGKLSREVLVPLRTPSYTNQTVFTANETKRNQNGAQAKEFIRLVGIAEEAKATNNITYSSRTEAIQVRESILVEVDSLMESTTDDTVYDSLAQLKYSLVEAIPVADQDLPDIQSLNVGNSSTLLNLSYELYGTVTQEADIILRNNIKHPGFISSGENLEVLIDG